MRIGMPLIIAATSLCLFATGSALADDPPGGAPPQSSTYAPEGATAGGPAEEVICKDIKQLGSRLQSQKVCMTRADWEVSEKKAKETTETWQRNGAPQRGH